MFTEDLAEDVVAAVDALTADDPAGLGFAGLLGRLRAVSRLVDRLEAERVCGCWVWRIGRVRMVSAPARHDLTVRHVERPGRDFLERRRHSFGECPARSATGIGACVARASRSSSTTSHESCHRQW
jgi:hypothetical protein